MLYHGDFSTRKAVHQLCFAYALAHKVNPNIHLTMIAAPGGRRDPHALTDIDQEARHFVRDANPAALDNFHITTAFIPQQQQITLYHTAQIYVHLGRGEAWNLTVGEAHATGALVIAPAFGGHVEFLLDEPWLPVYSCGISTLDQPDLVKVWHHQSVPFLKVDIEHAVIQMLGAAATIARRNGRRFPPRKPFVNRWSWDNAAQRLAHVLNTHARKEHFKCTWSATQSLQYVPRFLSSLSHAPFSG
jgi:glycosyltransferase involved in cell wall biosynthesis